MRIYLRPVTKEDGKKIVAWRNSARVSDHCFDKTKITEQTNAIFYDAYVVTGKYKQFIVERIDDDFGVASYSIATVYLKDIDITNKRAELCIFTSDDEEWNADSQRIAIGMLIDKAFKEFGLRKVYSYVFANFSDGIKLLKNAGLNEEAVLVKEAVNNEGEYVDVIRMATWKKE